MALNFPSAPTVDQEYTDPNGGVWVFDGTAWVRSRIPIAASLVSIIDAGGHYAADDVENALAEVPTKLLLKVNKAGDTMTGDLYLQKATPQIRLDAASGHSLLSFFKAGIARWHLYMSSSTDDFYLARHDAAGVAQSNPVQVVAATGEVRLTGAGSVTVPTPTATTHAARKDYVDTAAALKVAKAGDTMTGPLVVASANPRVVVEETDQAVDGKKWRIILANGSFIIESLNDAETLAPVRAFSATRAGVVSLNGSGVASVLVPTPTAGDHAARKDYVDAADALKVAKTGDTMTGQLTVQNTSAHLRFHDGTRPQADITTRTDGRTYIRTLNAAGAANASPQITLHGDAHASAGMVLVSATSLLVPAITGASQAAQVTAYDATTGRLAIGGHEIGDTGVRVLATWDAAGVLTSGNMPAVYRSSPGAIGRLWIRRTADTVIVGATNLRVAVGGNGTTEDILISVPSKTGFLPDYSTAGFAMPGQTGAIIRLYHDGARFGRDGGFNWTEQINYSFLCSYGTRDGWPATLPGVAG